MSDPGTHRRGGISLQTLIVASIASAAASFAVSRIWGPGTLISAAATPIIVALVSEFLRKPVETVASTAKRVPGQRGAWTAVPAEPADPAGPGQPRPRDEESTVTAPAASPLSRAHVRTAIATGLAAFAIVVAFFTLPDLVTGRSITGNGDSTTFFGGDERPRTRTVPPETVTAPPQTVTVPPPVTVTVPAPSGTATPPPPTSATPAPTATPAPEPTVTPPAATPTPPPAATPVP